MKKVIVINISAVTRVGHKENNAAKTHAHMIIVCSCIMGTTNNRHTHTHVCVLQRLHSPFITRVLSVK
jgi:hypothetical protein